MNKIEPGPENTTIVNGLTMNENEFREWLINADPTMPIDADGNVITWRQAMVNARLANDELYLTPKVVNLSEIHTLDCWFVVGWSYNQLVTQGFAQWWNYEEPSDPPPFEDVETIKPARSTPKGAELYPKYFIDVSDITHVDTYEIFQRYGINDPSGATQHALKKLLLSGVRTGGKDQLTDLREARDTINRKIEMLENEQ